MSWIFRPPALALLVATGLLSPVVFLPATLKGQVDNGPQTSSAQTSLLNSQPILMTITNDFQLSRGPTSFDRAVKELQEQMEKRRELELDKSSTLGALWQARFWDYLPRGSGSMNSPVTDKGDDDPFLTPSYLMLSNLILDRQLAESDARARLLFSR